MDYLTLIEFYYEKHYAIQQGDMGRLRELKNECPAIFDEKVEKEIRDIIDYAKAFQKSLQYKALRRLEMKELLFVVKE